MPNTTLLDDFNRGDAAVANGNPTLWTGTTLNTGVNAITNGLRVIGNQLGVNTNGTNGRTLISFGPAVDIFFDIAAMIAPSGSAYIAVWWALANAGTNSYSGNSLLIGIPTSTWTFRRYNNGGSSTNNMGSFTYSEVAGPSAGDSIWINSDGTTHKAYISRSGGDWELVLNAVDATYNRAGVWGIEIGNTAIKLDNLRGGTATSDANLYSRTGSDSAGASDAASRSISVPRAISDSTSASDAGTRLTVSGRNSTDSAPTSDSVTRGPATRVRSASDTTSLSDQASRASRTSSRTGSDSAPAADSADPLARFSRSSFDVLPVVSDHARLGGEGPPAWVYDEEAVAEIGEAPYVAVVAVGTYAAVVTETGLSPTGTVTEPGKLAAVPNEIKYAGVISTDPYAANIQTVPYPVGVITEVAGLVGVIDEG